MKWQAILDRERDTALGLAMLAADPEDLLEGGNEDGRVNVYASHWRDLELRVIDQDAINWFRHGNCAALAWELHVLTGFPLVAVEVVGPDTVGTRWMHAGVEMPDGRVLDIFGVRDVEEVVTFWQAYSTSELQATRLDPTDPAERMYFNDLVGRSPVDDVTTLLDETYPPLEREVIRDFARFLATAHLPDCTAAR